MDNSRNDSDIENQTSVSTSSSFLTKLKLLLPALALVVIFSGITAGTFLTKKPVKYNSKAAAPVDNCKPTADGECLGNSTSGTSLTIADSTNVGFDESTNSILPETTLPSCQNQVFLKIEYTGAYCMPGRECHDIKKETAVGWRGSNLADKPRKIYANSELIPLTNTNGVWLHDPYPVYRASPLVKGLGVTRVGDGRVVFSHAMPFQNRVPEMGKLFQAFNAKMTLTGARVNTFINGDQRIAPDQPYESPGTIAVNNGLDRYSDGLISNPPLFNNLLSLNKIGPCGGDEIIWTKGKPSWLHYSRICWPGDDYVMRLTCPIKATPTPSPTLTPTPTPVARCNIYPIALNESVVLGKNNGDLVCDIWNGSGKGNFGWLTWTGQPSEPVLQTSLIVPGNSNTYTNPEDPTDNNLSIGDVVQGRGGVTNSSGIRDALELLKNEDIIVPVWEATNCGGGNNSLYTVKNFAKVRIADYDLSGNIGSLCSAQNLGVQEINEADNACHEKPRKNVISAVFKGYVDCE